MPPNMPFIPAQGGGVLGGGLEQSLHGATFPLRDKGSFFSALQRELIRFNCTCNVRVFPSGGGVSSVVPFTFQVFKSLKV